MIRSGRMSCARKLVLNSAASVLVGFVFIIMSGTADAAPQAKAGKPSKIIRVLVNEPADWAAIEAIGATPLACRPGTGWQHVHAEADELDALQRGGFDFVVEVDDADAMVNATMERIERNRGARGAAWYNDFKDMAAINTRIDTIVAMNPAIATKVFVGNSLEGLPVYAIKITGAGGGDKKAVLFNGTQHAREWISPMVTIYLAEQFVSLYASDPAVQELVDAVEIYVVPVVNPDGYVYSWGPDRFWRKNRRDNGGSFGVDLNRNWPTDFGGPFSSGSPGSETYRGPFAMSEPESVIMDSFIAARANLVAHIDYHSFAQEILQPWGYTNTPPANFAAIDALGSQMSSAIFDVFGFFYPNASGAGGVGFASGIFPDWTTEQYNILGYTIELRPSSGAGGGFDPSPTIILPTAQENYAGALVMVDWAATRISVTFPNGQPSVLTPDQTTLLAVDITAQFDDVLVPATAKLFARTTSPGAFTESALSYLGGTSYEATLPATACGDTLEYYIQIENDNADALTNPRSAPATFYSVDAVDQIATFADVFESDLGWTTETLGGATSGFWQRGVPVNDPNWDYDPASDADGSGQCWLTENANGNTDVDNGSVRLTSPVFDMTGATGVQVWTINYSYYLRLSNTDGSDQVFVEVNTDDVVPLWVPIAVHNTSSNNWQTNVIDETALVTAGISLTSTMQFRFTVNDGGTQSIVEGGIDGFSVQRSGCGTPGIPGDIVAPFGAVDVFDLLELLSNWGTGGTGADIASPTNVVDVFDLLELLVNWG